MARIIHVEDDDVMGGLVQHVLTGAGHLVGVIGHGTLAFETIAFKRPDLVILDQSLPGLSGLEILRRLRQLPATYLTPILMLTGRRDQVLADDALMHGVDDYLTKPYEPRELLLRRRLPHQAVHSRGPDRAGRRRAGREELRRASQGPLTGPELRPYRVSRRITPIIPVCRERRSRSAARIVFTERKHRSTSSLTST